MRDIFKKFGLTITMIALFAVIVLAATDPDVPINTIDSPGDLSTEQITQGLPGEAIVQFVIDATVPSGDEGANLTNATLWLETTITEINNTGFTGNYTNGTLAENQTITLVGLTETVTFPWINILDGEYIMWNVEVCNLQNNCSWLEGENKTFLMDSSFDSTAGTVTADLPVNGTTVSITNPVINFTAADDTWVKNVTLFFNYSNKDPFGSTGYAYPTMDNITYLENETLTNTGAVSPFEVNIENTTVTGIFDDFGINSPDASDGWYTYYLYTCDYNNNCAYSGNSTFEVDTTVPEITVPTTNSVANTADTIRVLFDITEPANVTLEWGTTAATADGMAVIAEYENSTSRDINMTGLLSNTLYYIDITVCDEWGNCNYTAAVDQEVTKEYSVTTGWNGFGILNTSVKLKDIRYGLNDDIASTISIWIAASQTFTNYVTALATNENETLTRGDAVLIDADSDTFIKTGTFLDTTNTTVFGVDVHFLTASNWTNFGALQNWNMNNITHDSGIQDNVTYISIFDNDDHRYVDHIVDWLWNNDTEIPIATNVWMWGDQIPVAYSWNRTQTTTGFENSTTLG